MRSRFWRLWWGAGSPAERLRLRQQTEPDCPGHGLPAIVHAEFLIDVGRVPLDSLRRDDEFPARSLWRSAFRSGAARRRAPGETAAQRSLPHPGGRPAARPGLCRRVERQVLPYPQRLEAGSGDTGNPGRGRRARQAALPIFGPKSRNSRTRPPASAWATASRRISSAPPRLPSAACSIASIASTSIR